MTRENGAATPGSRRASRSSERLRVVSLDSDGKISFEPSVPEMASASCCTATWSSLDSRRMSDE